MNSFTHWHRQQIFASPELAKMAEWVERDPDILPKVRHLPKMLAVIEQHRDNFVALWNASQR